MRWFTSPDPERPNESIPLALMVGELKARVDAMQREIERLKAPAPSGEPVDGLSSAVRAVIEMMSQGSGELRRHLEQQARIMRAEKMDDADIIAAIKRGS